MMDFFNMDNYPYEDELDLHSHKEGRKLDWVCIGVVAGFSFVVLVIVVLGVIGFMKMIN